MSRKKETTYLVTATLTCQFTIEAVDAEDAMKYVESIPYDELAWMLRAGFATLQDAKAQKAVAIHA